MFRSGQVLPQRAVEQFTHMSYGRPYIGCRGCAHVAHVQKCTTYPEMGKHVIVISNAEWRRNEKLLPASAPRGYKSHFVMRDEWMQT